ncbi:hypothetical protein EOM82_00360 [bacterium]|nr:hypothetical protein [bacterium]
MNLDDKKLLKEWSKLADSGVFESIETFATFYYANGAKPCYRINTSLPWSRDNIFCGDYSELLEYYRQQARNRIGEKHYYLTIEDIIEKNENGHIVLYAKCKCDCGNETEVLLKTLLKGNIRSCGCKHFRVKKETNSLQVLRPDVLKYWDYEKNEIAPSAVGINYSKAIWWLCEKCGYSFRQTIKTFLNSDHCPNCARLSQRSISVLYPKLIEEEWDYKRNTISPENCDIDSNDLIWWKAGNGQSYQGTIKDRIIKKDQSTSYAEQAILYYVKKVFNDTINRYILEPYNIELDIYVPSYKIAIEYDGAFWHKDKQSRDEYKNDITSQEGIFLIRVRESGLKDLTNNCGATIYRYSSYTQQGLHLNETINQVMQLIATYLENNNFGVLDIVKNLRAFNLTQQELSAKSSEIYAQYTTAYVANNISKTWLINYWDTKSNGEIIPNNISVDSNKYYYFSCANGCSIHNSPKSLLSSERLVYKECPFASERYLCAPQCSSCDKYEKLIKKYNLDSIKKLVKDVSLTNCILKLKVEDAFETVFLVKNSIVIRKRKINKSDLYSAIIGDFELIQKQDIDIKKYRYGISDMEQWHHMYTYLDNLPFYFKQNIGISEYVFVNRAHKKELCELIDDAASITSDDIKTFIDETKSPEREQGIHSLYKLNLLKMIGEEAKYDDGMYFEADNFTFDFIASPQAILEIMSILGIGRVNYSLKLFDNEEYIDKFISLFKKCSDTEDSKLISGCNDAYLEKQIVDSVATLSINTAQKLYSLLMYIQTGENRPYPCWTASIPKAEELLMQKIKQSNNPIIVKEDPVIQSVSVMRPSASNTTCKNVVVETKSKSNNIKSNADDKKRSKPGLGVMKEIFAALLSVVQVVVTIFVAICSFIVALFFGKSIKTKRRSNAAKKGWKTRKLNDKFVARKRRSPINKSIK